MGDAGAASSRELAVAVAADFWRVGSYGYPNPFSPEQNAQQAWKTFLSFCTIGSYVAVKRYWAAQPRALDHAAVESWKSAFEEFGLLWVPTGSDHIRITPAGGQFRAAAEARNEEEFLWIGLNLLLRFPLRGPRRPKGPLHATSDLLLYWYLYAVMRDVHDYVWWTELTRVLCQVFRVAETQAAASKVLALREGRASVNDFPRAARTERGALYNSLNQVIVHAGLNGALIEVDRLDSPYTQRERRHWLVPERIYLVDRALSGGATGVDCGASSGFVARMPRAPVFGDEADYFDYMGSGVPPMPPRHVPPRAVVLDGQTVVLLRVGPGWRREGTSAIVGDAAILCALAREQRVIMSDDLHFTYLVEDKERRVDGQILVRLRRARPISDAQVIRGLLEEEA